MTDFIGKPILLEQNVIHPKKEFMVEFRAFEFMGSEIGFTPAFKPITNKEDIQDGDFLFAPGFAGEPLFGQVSIRPDGKATFKVADLNAFEDSSRKLIGTLEFDQDSRHCWVLSCWINMAALERIELKE